MRTCHDAHWRTVLIEYETGPEMLGDRPKSPLTGDWSPAVPSFHLTQEPSGGLWTRRRASTTANASATLTPSPALS
ncbi:hypothetical protein SRHO_G00057410 [Serrasalmus rhombeus]